MFFDRVYIRRSHRSHIHAHLHYHIDEPDIGPLPRTLIMLFHWSLPWQVLPTINLLAVNSVWICFKCIGYWYAVKFMAFLRINITFFLRRNTAYSSNLIATFIWFNESTRSPSNVNDKKWKSIRIHCIYAVVCILDGHQDHWHRECTHFRKRSEKCRSFLGESCWFRWMKALEQREVAVERESIICIRAWSEARMNFDRTRLWICALYFECVRLYVKWIPVTRCEIASRWGTLCQIMSWRFLWMFCFFHLWMWIDNNGATDDGMSIALSPSIHCIRLARFTFPHLRLVCFRLFSFVLPFHWLQFH